MKIPPFYPSLARHWRPPWRPEDVALLGKISDGNLAKRLGLTKTSVIKKRQSLGIAPLHPHRVIEWTPAMLERLGKASDSQIAEELGVALSTVLDKRHELGIPATIETRPVERSAEVADLLRLPSHVIKRLKRVNLATVTRLRRDLGVEEPVLEPPPALAGSGKKARGSPGVGEGTAYAPPALWRAKCSWKPQEIALLGTASDSEVARRLGRSPRAVEVQRLALGIRIWKPQWRPFEPEEMALLGTATDAEVAARLGRHADTVKKKRRALGIPAFAKEQSRRPARLGGPKDRVVLGNLDGL